jgi:hypothetical protein
MSRSRWRSGIGALAACAALWAVLIVIRVLRLGLPGRAMPLVVGAVVLAALGALVHDRLPSPRLYYSYDDAEYERYQAIRQEDVYYRQPALVASVTTTLLEQRPGTPDLYFVGFAGDGECGVFIREAEYARSVFDERYGTEGRSVVLGNSLEQLDDAPLANSHNLALVLAQIAARMDPEEDALFLFLTSHGSEDAALAVSLYPFAFEDLTAPELRQALDDAGIGWRIIVISACHSGSFMDALRDERTAIVTAASREKRSFGCADDRELTYFGEALFRDAFTERTDLLTAFERASAIVSAREVAEGLEPSEPQIEIGSRIAEPLAAIEGRNQGVW